MEMWKSSRKHLLPFSISTFPPAAAVSTASPPGGLKLSPDSCLRQWITDFVSSLPSRSQAGDLSSLLTTVLSEPSALQLYPVNARGHTVVHGTRSRESSSSTLRRDTLPRPLLEERADLWRLWLDTGSVLVARAFFCLIHSVRIEAFSFLPHYQRDGCDLSSNCQ